MTIILKNVILNKLFNLIFITGEAMKGVVYGSPIIGVFYGSDTQNTETVANRIVEILNEKVAAGIAESIDIADSSKEEIDAFDFILFGIPTWYYGEAQCDWDDFFPELEQIDFSGKLVAIFGCGDQVGYAEYFLDAMGMVRDIVEPKGALMLGEWPTDGYDFIKSKGLTDDNQRFVGLGIDEDCQPELTEERIQKWCDQIIDEMSLQSL